MDFTERLTYHVSAHGITGASFAYWDGTDLHLAVAGVRNSVTGDPVTTDTVMHIGSITKVLNAVLLMQLVDDGKVSLNDLVSAHLPRFRLGDEEALKHITCEMLLSHRTGINGDWLSDRSQDEERIVDAVERCAELGQLFKPGKAVSYCNIATVIAGFLTQEVRAKSWYSLIRERIYDPLEMRHALAHVSETPKFRCSVGDLTDPSTGVMSQTSKPFLSQSFAPAGSTLMMSAADLIKFARSVSNWGDRPDGTRLLSVESMRRMAKPIGKFTAPAYEIGLGWMIAPGGVLTHSGVGPGVQSILYVHQPTGRAVALLTNCDRGNAVWSTLLQPIIDSWIEPSRGVAHTPAGMMELEAYVGVYESNLQRIEVFLENGRLAARINLKMKLYDNSPCSEGEVTYTVSLLTPIRKHTFEVAPLGPGYSKGEYTFVESEASGEMEFLGVGFRLLRRNGQ